MKIIQKLSDFITDEIEGAKCYIKMAIENKDEHRELSDTLYDISTQEMNHVNILHGQVVNIIEEYRKTKGEPPAEMMFVYEYLHKKQIEAANRVKVYQQMYKGL